MKLEGRRDATVGARTGRGWGDERKGWKTRHKGQGSLCISRRIFIMVITILLNDNYGP